MRILCLIALVMTALILSIPIVNAQELSIQQLNGKGSSKGVARTHDELTIEVLVKIPGEEPPLKHINESQVRLYVEDSYTTFDSCVHTAGGYYKCTFYDSDFEAYEPIDFTIELRDDDGNIVGSETKTLIVDANAPVITSYVVEPNVTSGEVSISYAVEDYGLQYGNTDRCAGIKQVIITAGNQSVTSAGQAEVCTKDDTIQLTLQKAGKQQVCATATDHANYASAPKCTLVRVDKAPPDIEKLSILDESGFVITHVHSGEERTATITVKITDDGGIEGSEVFGNFYQLNPNLPDSIPPDISSGDLYSWKDIAVSEVNPCQIKITAKDTLGNSAEKTFPCDIRADDIPPTVERIIAGAEAFAPVTQPEVTGVQITGGLITGLVVDETPPVISDISPSSMRGNVPLYGYGTPIIIEFKDTDNTGAPGIGMSANKAYLDLSKLSMGHNVQADVCSRLSGALWRCAWFLVPPITVNEGTYTITVSDTTSDDLENKIGSTQSFEIIYDNTGPKTPQMGEFKVITGEAGVEYTGGAVRGNFVQYHVRSGDFETAFANFTEIGGDAKTSPTSCTDINGTYSDCIFESLVDLSGPYTAHITFTFADDANNFAHISTILEVYGIDNETNAKYWKTPPAVTCSPRLIDRSTASLVPPIATCRVDLETPRKDITTLAIAGPQSPDECTGDVELTLNDIYVTNNYEGSTHPYLFLKLEPKDYYVNDIEINCPLTVYSKRAVSALGKTVYYVSPEPQEIPVNMSLKLYNNPLGEIDANLDDEIRRAMKSGLADQAWISDLRKWLSYGEMMCQIKTIITSIIGALYMITVILGVTAVALKAGTITYPAGEALGQTARTLCSTEEDISEGYKEVVDFLDSICSVVNCAAVGGKGAGITSYIGGGVPWCADARDMFGSLELTGGLAESSGYTGTTVKDSLIMSVICLCLPGIIYNLDKLRQISCFKAVCLHDDVKLSGYPPSMCDEMYGYMICAFVIGEIFSLFPFVAFFDQLISIVLDLITNPVALFMTALGAVCTISGCASIDTQPVTYILCALLKTVSVIAEAVAAVKTFQKNKDAFGSVGNNWCDRMEDIEDEMEAA